MRHAPHPHQRRGPELGRRELERRPHLHRLLRQIRDNGTSRIAPVGVEQVRRLEVLAVCVVDRLVALCARPLDLRYPAEAAAADEHPGVGQEDGDGVVVAGDGVGRELCPFLRLGVEQLGDEDAFGVGEDEGFALAAGHEDGAVRQDDGVGEAAGEGEIGDALDGRGLVGLADGGDVRLCGSQTIGVVLGSGGAEDLSSDGVVHDPDAAHGVLGVAGGGLGDGPLARGAEPVLVFSGAGLENGPLFPAEEPRVVVLAPDALVVLGEDGLRGRLGEHGPLLGLGVVDFAVFGTASTGVGAADCEHAAVGEDGGRLVPTGYLHVGGAGEVVGLRVVDADGFGVGATLDEDAAVGQLGDGRAEHVVLGVCDLAG